MLTSHTISLALRLSLFLLLLLIPAACARNAQPTAPSSLTTQTPIVYPATWTPTAKFTNTARAVSSNVQTVTPLFASRTTTPIATPAISLNEKYDALAYVCEIPGPFGSARMRICVIGLDPAANATPIVVSETDTNSQVTDDYNPIWSPDKTRIAFIKQSAESYNLFVMNSDGTNKIAVLSVNSKTGALLSPVWSPDSNRIAYLCRQDNSKMRLCLINADGSGNIQLNEPTVLLDSLPAWSPNGSQIALDVNGELYRVDVRAADQIKLLGKLNQGREPAWSPDGTRIAFTKERKIYVIPANSANGAQAVQLTRDKGLYSRPTWSPDGTRIAFISESENSKQVYAMNVDGSEQIQLTNNLAGFAASSAMYWSPDGKRLVYVCETSSLHTNICLVNADGSGQTILSKNPLLDMEPVWRP